MFYGAISNVNTKHGVLINDRNDQYHFFFTDTSMSTYRYRYQLSDTSITFDLQNFYDRLF